MLHWGLVIILLNHIDVSITDPAERDGYTMPDYDYYWTVKSNLKNVLSKKIALKKQSDAKLLLLKERIANDTEYFDEVPHFKISGDEKIKNKSIQFQDDFKRIIGMVGVTYTYKRDLYWRTWREVTYPNSSKELICYKCQNVMNFTKSNNCTDCHRGGYWTIEDTPPSCSLEIFSFTGNKQLCVGNFWDLNKMNLSSCPTLANFEEISQCNNPLVTKLHISPDYSTRASERASSVICQGRETCEFSTFYKIDSEIIIFRIINSSSDVIYSRIMKSSGENYACTEDCGHFDLDRMTLTRNEKHLILNLLNYSRKRKRDNSLSVYKKDKTMSLESKNALSKSLFHKTHKYVIEQPLSTEKYPMIKSTMSFCNQMALRENDKDYDIE